MLFTVPGVIMRCDLTLTQTGLGEAEGREGSNKQDGREKGKRG